MTARPRRSVLYLPASNAKALDKAMVMSGIRLLAKSGGRSGDWRATP